MTYQEYKENKVKIFNLLYKELTCPLNNKKEDIEKRFEKMTKYDEEKRK